MKLLTYQTPDGPRAAALAGRLAFDLQTLDPDLPTDLNDFLKLGPQGIERAELGLANQREPAIPLEQITYLPPILAPSKILCVGVNYADHAPETGKEVPNKPIIFNKLSGVLSSHNADILLPRVSEKVDYEAELVVVIGKEGRYIDEENAMDYVAGYTCGNDVSVRDWQLENPGGQWLLGKSFDTTGPIGPWIVTPDELTDPHKLGVRSILNGETMQNSNTSQFIFPIPRLIAFISQVTTLLPGDLIFTGTPSGVGMARKPPVFLKEGDLIEVEIEGIGTLQNRVVADSN